MSGIAIELWALLALQTLGTSMFARFEVETAWKHGIDPLRATPRRRYYELRGWEWKE